MNWRLPFLGLLLLLQAVPASAADERYARVEQLMKERRAEWGAPGIAVAIVENGRLAWVGADGYSDVENRVPATPDTVWRIASVSKSISATAVLQLQEQNKVTLDSPIWDYLPWYPRKGNAVITIRHLLSNTSGIRHYRYDEGEKESTQAFASVQEGSHIHGVDQEPLQFQPGTQYLYSSYGYLLIAGIVERASGQDFESYLQTHIFKPAGMSGARLDKHAPLIPSRAHFYRNSADGLINAPYVDASYKWSAGGILATAPDLAKFAIALDDGTLLSEQARREATTPYILQNGQATDYGLGWHVRNENGRRWVYHSGGATGGSAWLLRVPEERFAVVFLCNLERPGDGRQLAMDIANAVLPATAGAK